jgi:hypothetical protein
LGGNVIFRGDSLEFHQNRRIESVSEEKIEPTHTDKRLLPSFQDKISLGEKIGRILRYEVFHISLVHKNAPAIISSCRRRLSMGDSAQTLELLDQRVQ